MNFKGFRKNNIPIKVAFILSIVPLLSLIILIFEVFRKPDSDVFFFINSILLLTINIAIFFIFKSLVDSYDNKLNLQSIENYSNILNLYRKNTSDSFKRLKALEHDLRNKLIPLQFLYENNEKNIDMERYLEKILGEFKNEFTISDTGLMEVDAIINYKYNYCKEHDIAIELNIAKINPFINSLELAVIIGNLLDNAIEATSKVSNSRIKFILRSEKGVLFLIVENTYDGKIISDGDDFISRKERDYGGLGLKNVNYLVKKLGGEIRFEYDNNKFNATMIFYES